jgi:hypothetical protein
MGVVYTRKLFVTLNPQAGLTTVLGGILFGFNLDNIFFANEVAAKRKIIHVESAAGDKR